MEKEEIFRIFDVCRPTVAQVREYLEKIASTSPFELIFRKDDKEYFSKKIAREMGELVGIVVDKTIFYVKPMTFDNVKDMGNVISTDMVFSFAQKIHAKAKPMDERILEIFLENRINFQNLSEMLAVYGYAPCYNQSKYLLIENDGNHFGTQFSFTLGHCGKTDIANFLRFCGNIYFYASL